MQLLADRAAGHCQIFSAGPAWRMKSDKRFVDLANKAITMSIALTNERTSQQIVLNVVFELFCQTIHKQHEQHECNMVPRDKSNNDIGNFTHGNYNKT